LKKPKLNYSIVLVAPEIPGNTGSIGRTCLALGIPLILIHPLGFDLDEKAVRRAGLDYWKDVSLEEFDSWDDFLSTHSPQPSQLCLFSSHATTPYFKIALDGPEHRYLVFGGETAGLPMDLIKANEKSLYTLPMYSDKVRSLNLSNVVTAVAYEGVRQNLA
jgi:tRNA (cytidine/uridine-2'-O-)-methyltransferase